MHFIGQTFTELDDETRREELRVQRYFESRGYTIEDKRNCKIAQSEDIDFEARLDKQHIKVEVKADKQMHRTGNILIEISHKRPVAGKTAGWFKKCKADLVCYSDVVNNKGYILNWKKMKNMLLGNHKIIGFDNPHDYGTRTYGFLIPIKEAKDNGYIVEEYFFA